MHFQFDTHCPVRIQINLFLLEYSYIWLHMIDNLLFHVENIILRSSIIYFMGPLRQTFSSPFIL